MLDALDRRIVGALERDARISFGELAEEVGFPKGVVNVVTGSAGEIGDELCTN
ncbi:MAG: aldehyde dehydrogenase family protein, partial [Mesorhizobium sp.]